MATSTAMPVGGLPLAAVPINFLLPALGVIGAPDLSASWPYAGQPCSNVKAQQPVMLGRIVQAAPLSSAVNFAIAGGPIG